MDMKKFVDGLTDSERIELLELLNENSNKKVQSFKDLTNDTEKLDAIDTYLEIYSTKYEFAKNFSKAFRSLRPRIVRDLSMVSFNEAFFYNFKNRIRAMVQNDNKDNILVWMGFEEKAIINVGDSISILKENMIEKYYDVLNFSFNSNVIVTKIEYNAYILGDDIFKGFIVLE